MQITERLLTKSEWVREGEKLKGVQAVVMHNVGVAGQRANEVWKFFENRSGTYGSAHYIIDQNGSVIRCIPEDEVAFHAGSKVFDPASGKLYTDESRRRFGTRPDGNGYCPNSRSIGIELCQIDDSGTFTDETIDSAIELVADILKRHSLGVDAITTHHNLVGWKDCPKLWTDHPALLEAFRDAVKKSIEEK